MTVRRTYRAVGVVLLSTLFLFCTPKGLSQEVTVQVAKPNGVAPQGMIVVVKARLHKYGEQTIIEETRSGWTDNEGKVTLKFAHDNRYYFDGDAVISCGSGILSKEEKQVVPLGGTEPKIFFQRKH